MSQKIKVILPASEIPILSKVTKLTGTNKYTLRKELIVYSEDPKLKRVMNAEEGTIFLVDASGNAKCVNSSTQLVWETDIKDLQDYIQDLLDEENDK
jgi:hypothetical protein